MNTKFPNEFEALLLLFPREIPVVTGALAELVPPTHWSYDGRPLRVGATSWSAWIVVWRISL